MWPVMKKRRSSGTVVILIGGVADQVVKAEDSSDCHFSDAVEKRPKVAALFFVGFFADESDEFDNLDYQDGENLVFLGSEEDQQGGIDEFLELQEIIEVDAPAVSKGLNELTKISGEFSHDT